MGNIFSHSDATADPNSPNAALKRQLSSTANNANLKQTIAQNMRLSKNKINSLLKANHMNYSIVHRNHFYNTLPHVLPPRPLPPPPFCRIRTKCDSILVWRICLERLHKGYLIFLMRSVSYLSHGLIRLMKLLGLIGIGGWAINGMAHRNRGVTVDMHGRTWISSRMKLCGVIMIGREWYRGMW